ncbi:MULTISPECIES: ADP-ribosylglycohydrolase family protein [unclassified Streptomyces]|uniref:ADP-ribosylglycohydrolase family protein n=1 Tax=unclassified Streptomyces TaxID=2593676 RepID=UPI002E33FF66|nr:MULTISPECIES: ADP-ribosylglycohydrolase family protein [unclassified Streptomyces]WUC66877.1 ADP-ribosylglycohydrolase family protein [Streptomyces sp. NBC_00539]
MTSPTPGGPAPAAPARDGGQGPAAAGAVRLTWVQPEDLVGHELRQAAQDGRDAEPLLRAWLAAGGHPAPERAGASSAPAGPGLRALAARLLTELAALPRPSAADEPESWQAITATWPRAAAPGPAPRSAPPPRPQPERPQGRPGPRPGPQLPGNPPAARPEPYPGPRPAPQAHPDPHPHPDPQTHAAREPEPRPVPQPHPGPQPRPRPAAAGAPRGSLAAGPGDGRAEAGLVRRLEAAWVGRAVGCVLGKPVEKLPLDGIRRLARAAGNWPLDDWFTARGVPAALLAAYPWNRRSAPTSLAENIDGAPEDDDLNYPLLGLLLLQRHGKGFTTADVGRLWLDELPAGRTFTAERIAYRNLLQGLEPPATATHHNPFREWIGALIRADVHGWTNPGDPAAAAAQAYRDAVLTHTANGVYAALFVAAALAEAATGRADIHTALRAGLAVVPPRSRLARAVRHAIDTAAGHTDFDRVVDVLHARHGHCHWVHAVPNTALIAAALTHADGDFTHSVCRAVSGGWDTDSNGATAGSLAALVAGEVPHRWAAPLKNRLATTVAGFDGIGFDTLAHLTAQEAARS